MIDNLSISIWDRDFELPVNYNCYEEETVTTEQVILLDKFLNHPEWILKSKDVVEKYCRNQVLADKKNQKKDNIFSYVKPVSVFVKHVKSPRIALMCKYRYDEEHGLAIAFDNNGNIYIGTQDIIL